MLLLLSLLGGVKSTELALRIHNDFWKKYRKAQAEGRL